MSHTEALETLVSLAERLKRERDEARAELARLKAESAPQRDEYRAHHPVVFRQDLDGYHCLTCKSTFSRDASLIGGRWKSCGASASEPGELARQAGGAK